MRATERLVFFFNLSKQLLAKYFVIRYYTILIRHFPVLQENSLLGCLQRDLESYRKGERGKVKTFAWHLHRTSFLAIRKQNNMRSL